MMVLRHILNKSLLTVQYHFDKTDCEKKKMFYCFNSECFPFSLFDMYDKKEN